MYFCRKKDREISYSPNNPNDLESLHIGIYQIPIFSVRFKIPVDYDRRFDTDRERAVVSTYMYVYVSFVVKEKADWAREIVKIHFTDEWNQYRAVNGGS